MQKFRTWPGLIGVLAFLPVAMAWAETNPAPAIPRFQTVVQDLYRGGTPGCAGVTELAQMGVRTIVNLDNRAAVAREEKTCAEALGLRWIDAGMSAVAQVSPAVVDQALAAMTDPALRPTFVHCQHGQDRTGLLVGLYRVEQQEWTPQVAYQEMLDIGFHAYLLQLDRYFKARTHF